MLPQASLLALLNHVLQQEPWARERLARFAGAVVEARLGPVALRAQILSSGLMGPAGVDDPPVAVIHLQPGVQEATGDEALAAELNVLLRHLRWDAEEDLSRVVGDVPAHRLVQAARDFLAWQRDVVRRLAESGAEYLARENGVLVTREELARISAGLQDLDSRIEELERRAARLG